MLREEFRVLAFEVEKLGAELLLLPLLFLADLLVLVLPALDAILSLPEEHLVFALPVPALRFPSLGFLTHILDRLVVLPIPVLERLVPSLGNLVLFFSGAVVLGLQARECRVPLFLSLVPLADDVLIPVLQFQESIVLGFEDLVVPGLGLLIQLIPLPEHLGQPDLVFNQDLVLVRQQLDPDHQALQLGHNLLESALEALLVPQLDRHPLHLGLKMLLFTHHPVKTLLQHLQFVGFLLQPPLEYLLVASGRVELGLEAPSLNAELLGGLSLPPQALEVVLHRLAQVVVALRLGLQPADAIVRRLELGFFIIGRWQRRASAEQFHPRRRGPVWAGEAG
ncbi:hypothetical protein B0T25DRAFT_553362 [Lasiosphaeria hispida]|uniref:Uncharacterized protein n=1 Tax=Lasiosphaeria hispida TaxID=260671 RepID=A0AAJ0HCU3_9PEZI|nr:hypothetical protein B0T25DRAFT_553362 [Lasiosphaeria hispida]